jgi:hypothetical protein
MKKLILSVFMLAALTARASDAVDAFKVVTNHFALAFSAATNLNLVVDVSKQANVMFQIASTNAAAETVNQCAFYYSKGTGQIINGTNVFEDLTTPLGWTSSSQNPAQYKVVTTNVATLGTRFLLFRYCTNSSGSATNLGDVMFGYAIKTQAP